MTMLDMYVPLSKKILILINVRTALHQAIPYGNFEIVELLALLGVDQVKEMRSV